MSRSGFFSSTRQRGAVLGQVVLQTQATSSVDGVVEGFLSETDGFYFIDFNRLAPGAIEQIIIFRQKVEAQLSKIDEADPKPKRQSRRRILQACRDFLSGFISHEDLLSKERNESPLYRKKMGFFSTESELQKLVIQVVGLKLWLEASEVAWMRHQLRPFTS